MSHLKERREKAEETTARLMADVYERALSATERAEFAALVADMKASVA